MHRKIVNIILIIILLISVCIVTSSAQSDFLKQLGDKINSMRDAFPGGGNGEHKDHYYLQITPNRTDVFRTKNITLVYSLSLTNPTNKFISKSGLKLEHIIPDEFKFLNCSTNCNYDKQNRKLMIEGFNFLENKPFEFSYNATILKTAPTGIVTLTNLSPKLTEGSSSPSLNVPETKINIMNNLPYLISPPYGSPKINKNIGKICRDTNITFFAEARDVEDKTLTYEWFEDGNLFHFKNSENSDKFNTTFDYGNHNDFELVIRDNSSGYIKSPIDLQFNVEPRNETEILQELIKRRQEYNGSIIDKFLGIILVLFIIFTYKKTAFIAKKVVAYFNVFLFIVYCSIYFLDKDFLTGGIIELFLLSAIMPCVGYFIISGFSDRTPDLKNPLPTSISEFSSDKLRDTIRNCLRLESVAKFKEKGVTKFSNEFLMNWPIWYATMFGMFFIITILVLVIPRLSPLADASNDAKYNHIWLYYSMMTQAFGAILAIIAMVAVATTKDKEKCTKITTKRITNFVILYSVIILSSIFGMAIKVAPDLDPSVIMGSPIDSIPLIIFVISLLLSVPAVVCLGKLILDFLS